MQIPKNKHQIPIKQGLKHIKIRIWNLFFAPIQVVDSLN